MSEKKDEKKDEEKNDEVIEKKVGEKIIVEHIIKSGTPVTPATPVPPVTPPAPAPVPNEKKDETPKKDEKKDETSKIDEKKDGKKTYTAEEYDAMKSRAEDAETIIEASAIVEFKREKDEFLATISPDPNDPKRKDVETRIGDDPETLDRYKEMAEFLTKMVREGAKPEKKEGNEEGKEDDEKVDDSSEPIRKKPAISGIPPAPTGATNYKEYVDGLYATLRSTKSTPEQKAEVNRILDDLFLEMQKGLKKKGQYPFISIKSCSFCSETMSDDAVVCPKCGRKMPVES